MRVHSDWQEELEAYFSGRLEGAMGLRSWLGRWEDHGPTRGGASSGSPPEPGGGALAAARETNRVEGALALCGERHARVLEARYTPRGPNALLQTYGGVGAVLLVLEVDVGRLLERLDDLELRRVLRCGSDARARDLLEEQGGLEHLTIIDRLLAVERASSSALRREQARRARQVRAHLKALGGVAVAKAGDAYVLARDRWQRQQRRGRLDRLRATVEGR